MYLCDLSLTTVRNFFKNDLVLPALTPQTALFGLSSEDTKHDEPIINHFLLFFFIVYLFGFFTDILGSTDTCVMIYSIAYLSYIVYVKTLCLYTTL